MNNKKPIIGISGNFRSEEGQCTLAEGYYKSIILAGGIPVIIPPHSLPSEEALGEVIDGLLLSGGGDIDPDLLGEEKDPTVSGIDKVRDEMEINLVRMAYNRQIPILGICKGAQIINFALGGSLYQDINGEEVKNSRVNGFCHSQSGPKWEFSHKVTLNGLIQKIFSPKHSLNGKELKSLPSGGDLEEAIPVNSFHHQAIKTPAPCLNVSAMSEDGIIEAVESNEGKSILGVQWHPEGFVMGPGNEESQHYRIFDWFVGEAKSYMEAKDVHNRIISLDSHCDTPMVFEEEAYPQEPTPNPSLKGGELKSFPSGEDLGEAPLWNIKIRNPLTLVDLEKMKEGHLDATIMVAYLKQEGRNDADLLNATKKADRILDGIERMAEGHIAYTPDDLIRMKLQGKKAVMMGIENGYAVGKDITNVERFRKRGVVYMTLCHNGDNDICDSAKGNGEHGGVSLFGADVIKEMNRVGMMVDLSHANENSFYDAMEISSLPIVCTHSSARALCDHPRNLTDEQMRALAKSGGVAQVTFYNGFLCKDGKATIDDAVNHLNHMVKVMGIEHVGIGTDFDGDGGVPGIASASELINFTRRLLAERYSEKDLEMIWGGNFLRIMRLCQANKL